MKPQSYFLLSFFILFSFRTSDITVVYFILSWFADRKNNSILLTQLRKQVMTNIALCNDPKSIKNSLDYYILFIFRGVVML